MIRVNGMTVHPQYDSEQSTHGAITNVNKTFSYSMPSQNLTVEVGAYNSHTDECNFYGGFKVILYFR